MTQTDTNDSAPPADDEIIASADPGYRWKHLIMAVLVIAGGLWFAYDGWVKWPAENIRADEIKKERADEEAKVPPDRAKVEKLAAELTQLKYHTSLDLQIQKALATVLPLFGIIWGAWTLRDTRGQYRLAGNTLEVPGHPPITFDNIRRIDKRKWDRKGIALIHYEHGEPPQQAVLKLDDFAYHRRATDAILEQIEQNVVALAQTPGAPRMGT